MLFTEWWEKEHWVYFSSLITYRASGMCEMNLWVKRLNKHIPPYWDGLATMIISQGWGMHARVCASPLFSSTVSSINNWSFMWIHFTTIHLTFTLIDTPPSKSRELASATGFHIKHTSRKPRWHKPYDNVLHLEICRSYSFVYIHSVSWEQAERSHARPMHVPVNKKGFVVFFSGTQKPAPAEKKDGDKHMQMRLDTLDHTRSESWEVSVLCKI